MNRKMDEELLLNTEVKYLTAEQLRQGGDILRERITQYQRRIREFAEAQKERGIQITMLAVLLLSLFTGGCTVTVRSCSGPECFAATSSQSTYYQGSSYRTTSTVNHTHYRGCGHVGWERTWAGNHPGSNSHTRPAPVVQRSVTCNQLNKTATRCYAHYNQF